MLVKRFHEEDNNHATQNAALVSLRNSVVKRVTLSVMSVGQGEFFSFENGGEGFTTRENQI
jgi:hypothetical protein